jgi:hypothetical protein
LQRIDCARISIKAGEKIKINKSVHPLTAETLLARMPYNAVMRSHVCPREMFLSFRERVGEREIKKRGESAPKEL